MQLIIAAYSLVGFSTSLFLLAFFIASLVEGKRRAAWVAFVLWTSFSCGWVLLYLISRDNPYVISAAVAAAVFFGFLFFMPLGKKRVLRISPGTARFDERDTVFARFDLEAGTDRYESYYADHPERKGVDDRIRLLPRLLSPGGRYFDPVRAPLVEALFDLESRQADLADGPINPEGPPALDPTDAAGLVKSVALELGAVAAGIAPLNRRYLYSHVGRGPDPRGSAIKNDHPFILAFAVEMRRQAVDQAPFIGITVETAQQYLRAQHVSINLAAYIRRLGYSARAQISGSNYQVILPAVAHEAGLGELGRCGYLISPRYGARIRLGAVTTDLPLDTDRPIRFGVQEFCERCQKCVSNCPSGSIPSGSKTVVRGVEKWKIDAESCFRYWRIIGTDCGLCMKVCPFSHPDSLVHNILRWGIKRSELARRVSLIGDDLLYGKRLINRQKP